MPADLYQLDEVHSLPLQRPASALELGEIVRAARDANQAIYPLGGGTMRGLGYPPARPGQVVCLTALDQVIDYPARDMTITVQAGITIQRLQALLAGEKQRLPVDVPRPAEATLGGALAVNCSGPRRYGFGTLRDYVIGITVVNDAGQETKAGGRVVKNVAGYDLCKLYVGALGTLGLISQVTLRLKPAPEDQALMVLGCESSRLGPILEQLHQSRTRPVAIDLLNRTAANALSRSGQLSLPDAPWILIVGYEENTDAVGWQVPQIVTEFPATEARAFEARLGRTAEGLWSALVDFQLLAERTLTFKANLLPHALPDFCQQAEGLSDRVLLQAHAGNGIVIGHFTGDWTAEAAGTLIEALLQRAVAAEGNLIVQHCPTAWKTRLPVWGRARGDLALMRAVKQQFDPHRIFNPGRFVDGI